MAPLRQLRPAIDEHFSLPTVRAILASLEAETRQEFADWARQTATLMRTRSPTMLAVTLRQLQRGKDMTLAECFRMELAMARQCFEQGDFIEGVRALIIDKDNTPRFRTPDRIEDLTDAMVDGFFPKSLDRGRPSSRALVNSKISQHLMSTRNIQ